MITSAVRLARCMIESDFNLFRPFSGSGTSVGERRQKAPKIITSLIMVS